MTTTHPAAMDRRVVGVRACVFDAYGTLFDVASAAARCAEAIGEITPRLAALWRDKQLQYSWLRTVQGRHADFWQVTGDALDFALDTFEIADPSLRERLMMLYRTLDAYPEVPAVLRQLRTAGFATAILSNGAPPMLAAAVEHAGLSDMFDHVLSIEDVGVYKPHPSVYRLACDRLGLAPGAIAFISSNGWDAWAASAYGMRALWCNRRLQPRERLPGGPDHEVHSLTELPALIELPTLLKG
ncbi:MAG TPA: haloacid dehalogenase type II [Stellaceae bacterium]|nr:haloacid dehalogenase type II [Stellaceae bacterium]